MLNLDIHAIKESDLQALIDEAVPESDTLEYKGQLSLPDNKAIGDAIRKLSGHVTRAGWFDITVNLPESPIAKSAVDRGSKLEPARSP